MKIKQSKASNCRWKAVQHNTALYIKEDKLHWIENIKFVQIFHNHKALSLKPDHRDWLLSFWIDIMLSGKCQMCFFLYSLMQASVSQSSLCLTRAHLLFLSSWTIKSFKVIWVNRDNFFKACEWLQHSFPDNWAVFLFRYVWNDPYQNKLSSKFSSLH